MKDSGSRNMAELSPEPISVPVESDERKKAGEGKTLASSVPQEIAEVIIGDKQLVPGRVLG